MKASLCFCTAVLCLPGLASIYRTPIALASAQDLVPGNYSATCATNQTETKTLDLTAADNGRQVRVGLGTEIRVKLEVQGGTGYGWYTDQLDESRLRPEGTWTGEVSPKRIAGGAVLGVWCFRAAAPGPARLRMLYYRVWEGRQHATKVFEVRLDIAGK